MAYAAQLRNMEVKKDGSFALRAPAYIEGVKLVANTHQEIPCPAGANYAVFSFNGDIWAFYVGGAGSPGGLGAPYYNSAATAAIPAATTTTGVGSELNPTARYIGGLNSDGSREVNSISLIAPADTLGSILFYT